MPEPRDTDHRRAGLLGRDVVDWIYSYPIAAPETLALLLGHTLGAASAEELLLGAFTSGRSGTTLAALAGAIAVVRFGTEWIPSTITLEQQTLGGIAVPLLRGRTVREAIEPRARQ